MNNLWIIYKKFAKSTVKVLDRADTTTIPSIHTPPSAGDDLVDCFDAFLAILEVVGRLINSFSTYILSIIPGSELSMMLVRVPSFSTHTQLFSPLTLLGQNVGVSDWALCRWVLEETRKRWNVLFWQVAKSRMPQNRNLLRLLWSYIILRSTFPDFRESGLGIVVRKKTSQVFYSDRFPWIICMFVFVLC